MKLATRAVLTGFFLLSSGRAACSQLDFSSAGSVIDKLSGSVVPQPAAPANASQIQGAVKTIIRKIQRVIKGQTPKKWTVMVFMNGKNDLESAGLYNVNQMEKVGSTEDMNIVVELGRMRGQRGDTFMDGNWTGARRLLIGKDADEYKITSPVVMSTDNADMGDYTRAADFVGWARKNYPAERYALILWDHGTGWLDPHQAKKTSAGKGISYDDETGNYIRTRQIGQILKETGRVDLLAFDACLMQTAEVLYEVKDYAEVVVGSEEIIPAFGYPYGLFLSAMAGSPGLTTEETGAVMVETFKMFYDAIKRGAQLSAVRTSKLGELGTRLAEFGALAGEAGTADALTAARNGVLRYDVLGAKLDPNMTISFFGDLSQYAALLAANAGNGGKTAALKAKAAALQEFIAGEVIINNKASGTNRLDRDLAESGGLSIYLPPVETRIPQAGLENAFEGKYADFAFNKATGWYDFVTYLYSQK